MLNVSPRGTLLRAGEAAGKETFTFSAAQKGVERRKQHLPQAFCETFTKFSLLFVA